MDDAAKKKLSRALSKHAEACESVSNLEASFDEIKTELGEAKAEVKKIEADNEELILASRHDFPDDLSEFRDDAGIIRTSERDSWDWPKDALAAKRALRTEGGAEYVGVVLKLSAAEAIRRGLIDETGEVISKAIKVDKMAPMKQALAQREDIARKIGAKPVRRVTITWHSRSSATSNEPARRRRA